MSPFLQPGMWVWVDVCPETANLRLGEVIVFRAKSGWVSHRLIGFAPQGFWEAGDRHGNWSRIRRSDVIGRVTAREDERGRLRPFTYWDRLLGLLRCYGRVALRWARLLRRQRKRAEPR